MNTGLQKYFPMIRTREEVLAEIESQKKLSAIFNSWEEKPQNEFLDFVTGAKGVKILYDSFFKEIMNPETTPERLEEFLSLLLGEHVKIKCALPTDNSRIADESSLVIMDILIELEDGSLANLEAQKVGYMFPGQRIECYSADLLLRQYKRVRGEKNKEFSYRDIKKVYTIILYEHSGKKFSEFPNDYLHWIRPKSDTGLELEWLQEHLLIPLDIFRRNLQNKGINNKLDAWLTFLSVDKPEIIEQLIKKYPQFKPMYQQIYEICRNTERVMELYSEELRIMDRNTVQLMIDIMQKRIDEQSESLLQNKEQLSQKDTQLSQKDAQLSQKDAQLSQKDVQLSQKDTQIEQQLQEIERLKRQLVENQLKLP